MYMRVHIGASAGVGPRAPALQEPLPADQHGGAERPRPLHLRSHQRRRGDSQTVQCHRQRYADTHTRQRSYRGYPTKTNSYVNWALTPTGLEV